MSYEDEGILDKSLLCRYDGTRATNVISFLNEAYNYAVTVVGLVATVIKTGVL